MGGENLVDQEQDAVCFNNTHLFDLIEQYKYFSSDERVNDNIDGNGNKVFTHLTI